MANPRKIALSVLLKIEKDNAYSNISLASQFKESDLNPTDKGLATSLVYGVLDRKITLDYVLSKFIKTPIKKTAPLTLNVLRLSLFQIMYMDKIPDSAAVNEGVKLIKSSKESRNAGFVNGVLRNILRNEITLPTGNSEEDLSIRYSFPLWILEELCHDYPFETVEDYLTECLNTPPVTLRINNVKTNVDFVMEELEKIGIETEKTQMPNCIIAKKGFDIENNELYKQGYFHIQDLASQMAVSQFNLKSGDRVLDMCASPGGKSFTMAEMMNNKGEIVSCDLYESRTNLIRKSARRLGLDIIKPTVQDATVYNEKLGKFDYILCDVPCSGFGVIRRKPEIKYKKSEDFKALQKIQLKIISNAVKCLKPNGKILYSTCTLRKQENEKLVILFKKEYNNFTTEFEHTYMPNIDGTDGFYCCLLKSQ